MIEPAERRNVAAASAGRLIASKRWSIDRQQVLVDWSGLVNA